MEHPRARLSSSENAERAVLLPAGEAIVPIP